jgi:hypothetical protein
MSGSVAFLAPEMGMAPLRRCPPTMRMRSIPPLPAPAPWCLLPETGPCYGPPAGRGQSQFIAGLPCAGAPNTAEPGRKTPFSACCRRAPAMPRGPAGSGRHDRVPAPCAGAGFRAARRPGAYPARALCRIFRFPSCREGIKGPRAAGKRAARQGGPDRIFAQPQRCRSSVVEHPLGKGEVVSSILTGSTGDFLPNDSAFQHKINDLMHLAAVDGGCAASPVSTRTKREVVCQLTQNWHTESCFVHARFSTPGAGHAGPDHCDLGGGAVSGNGAAVAVAVADGRMAAAARRRPATRRLRSAQAMPSPASSPVPRAASGHSRHNAGGGR